jgi:7-keto-8-aminopelargonate synthetase-like enzyme
VQVGGKFGQALRSAGQQLRRAVSVNGWSGAPLYPACDFSELPIYRAIVSQRATGKLFGVVDPFFRCHTPASGCKTNIDSKTCLNFASFDYLGLSRHPKTCLAAKAAIDDFGTSATASRVVAGERPVHRKLERALAQLYGVEGAIAFVSGHGTNVSTISALMGSGDLVVHDELMHNSALMGAKLSQATTLSFRHNDLDALERLLGEDVIGSTGLGSAEYHNIDPRDVDIWMGTLSKALGSCGGYIAGKNELIETLKFNAASFVYSVGLSPPIAAAAEVALDVLRAEPQRVRRLQENGLLFLNEAKASGLNTGISEGYAVVSIMIGDILKAVRLSELLLNRGINALPIIYPAVPMKASRLRFFITSEHTSDEIKLAVKITRQEIGNLKGWKNGAKSPSVQLSDNEPKPNMAVSGKC